MRCVSVGALMETVLTTDYADVADNYGDLVDPSNPRHPRSYVCVWNVTSVFTEFAMKHCSCAA